MKLIADNQLEQSPVVANCRMNRERNLRGANGYEKDLRFDPIEYLTTVVSRQGRAAWLDLCCGSAKALVEAAEIFDCEQLPVTIVGVDLVGMFVPVRPGRLRLVEASLTDWEPTDTFDLITCVHGLHYIGDKLDLIARTVSWLTESGRFVANLDNSNLLLDHGKSAKIVASLRQAGVQYSARHKLLQCEGRRRLQLPYRYLGADDAAGPNYTGQPAVNSHYALGEE